MMFCAKLSFITFCLFVLFLTFFVLDVESKKLTKRKAKTTVVRHAARRAAMRTRRQLSEFIQPFPNTWQGNRKTTYESWVNCQRNPECDPRSIEDWWMLYPYGKKVLDNELLGILNRETQINLGFDCPYYGFRFNYTQVWPGGFISFAMPPPIMPPFDFPNPRWPLERDHSFIAPFYADSAFQYVTNTKISNVWYRAVHRPRIDNPAWLVGGNDQGFNQQGYMGESGFPSGNAGYREATQYGPGSPYGGQFGPGYNTQGGQFGGGGSQYLNPQIDQMGGRNYRPRKKRQIPAINQAGDVIDVRLLDDITRDIQEGFNGANGWRAEHALIVTWERVAYGGARKHVDVHTFEHVLQWQNTFQLVLASDQIRTFAMFNYARLNWTTSNSAGGLNGYGGFQPAMVGFNGGNGTGFTPLPYSGEGRNWKLAYFSNVMVPGRWIYRVDEEIVRGGCSNASTGFVVASPNYGTMVGGISVNISGPCLRPGDYVKVVFDEWPVDCARLQDPASGRWNIFRARCIMPPFHKTGRISLRMSRDGGQSYPYIGWFYVLPPQRSNPKVFLEDSVQYKENHWTNPYAQQLRLHWQAWNLTTDPGKRVDVSLWGYYEDAFRSYFEKVDNLATQISNTGRLTINPPTMPRNALSGDSWKKFHFGMIQVAVSDTGSAAASTGMLTNKQHGALWSLPTPFSWYWLDKWIDERGSNWATDLCIDWFEYDGRRENFIRNLEPCPCRMEQALLDLGRFMPLFDCDKDGNGECEFHKGALHCIQSVQSAFDGSGQRCCYDYEGYLMFTDDWEPTGDLTKFYQPGTPARGHAFGSAPFTRQPPRIPGFSHYQNDLLPYYMCCKYADHCEFYYWRRHSHGCQGYYPPGAAYIYGEPHIRTFDGTEYTFSGKGYYVLVMSEDPVHQLMIQGRFEQPEPTLWRANVSATVVTGIAIRENNSDIVQVFARKPFRRWRYRTDVYVNGIQVFFDKPFWKYQQFTGVSIRSPQLNMNQSELIIMLNSGAAVRVMESYGMLDVMVTLPYSFNSTCDQSRIYNGEPVNANRFGDMRPCYITRGLLGAWNGNPTDDLMTLDGTPNSIPQTGYDFNSMAGIHESFGMKWHVDPKNPRIGPVLFQDRHQPIYNPLQFADRYYRPIYIIPDVPRNAQMIFSLEEVDAVCMGQPQCRYDYLMTGRREIALSTLTNRLKFLELQREGSRLLVSCGPLARSPGIIKTPPRKNYLDGDVVQFTCKAGYFIHGTPERVCLNGTWTPGWWAWCRDRDLEYGLKWLTGILVSLVVILIIVIIFCVLWKRRVRNSKGKVYRTARPTPITYKPEKPPIISDIPPPVYADSHDNGDSFDREPARVGLATRPVPHFVETTA